MKSLSVRALRIGTLFCFALFAERVENEGMREQAEALVSALKFQQGEIMLQGGLATTHVPMVSIFQ